LDASRAAETSNAQLALVFSTPDALGSSDLWQELRALYPAAQIVGCSTAGEIADVNVLDESIVCTSVSFEHSRWWPHPLRLDEASDSAALGTLPRSRLPPTGLVHVLVLSDGLNVNGSALAQGIAASLPTGVAVTGGLSADGGDSSGLRSASTVRTRRSKSSHIGLYGERLRIGYGSLAAGIPSDPNGGSPEPRATSLRARRRTRAPTVQALPSASTLAALPASGLLFPLAIRSETADEQPVVRTILAVDESTNSLTFAGDVPTGCRARLMRANFERLVDGAAGAARIAEHIATSCTDSGSRILGELRRPQARMARSRRREKGGARCARVACRAGSAIDETFEIGSHQSRATPGRHIAGKCQRVRALVYRQDSAHHRLLIRGFAADREREQQAARRQRGSVLAEVALVQLERGFAVELVENVARGSGDSAVRVRRDPSRRATRSRFAGARRKGRLRRLAATGPDR